MNPKISRPAREGGITLVELLIVVAVILVLAAIAVPFYLNQQDNARKSKLVSDMRNVAVAVETVRPPGGGALPGLDEIVDEVMEDTLGGQAGVSVGNRLLVFPNCSMGGDGVAVNTPGSYVIGGVGGVGGGSTLLLLYDSGVGEYGPFPVPVNWDSCRTANGGSGAVIYGYAANGDYQVRGI